MPSQDLTVELYIDGAWQDITADDDVFTQPIKIQRGQGDESAAPRPAQITMQLANDDDRYRTSNPQSPLYGKAGRNTPLRASVGDTVRGVVEASSWRTGQTSDFRRYPKRGRAWTDVQGGGLLQRIGQWTEPVQSPFYVYNINLSNLLGYWPHEDPKGARSLFAAVPGSRSDKLGGAQFGGDRFAGSAPLATFPNNSSAFTSGFFAPTTAGDTDGWQMSFCIKPGDLGSTGDVFNFFNWRTRDGKAGGLSFVDGNSILMLVEEDDGTDLISSSQLVDGFGTNWNLWQEFVVEASYSAGTVTISIAYNTEGSDDFVEWGDTYSGITSQPSGWNAVFGGGQGDVGFGHMVAVSGTSPAFLSVDRLVAFSGYAGETAADRFDRLCTLKGVDFTILGTAADSYPMGPQGYDTLANHFKEIVTTEDGLLYDDIDSIGLVLMLRGERYNQTPALTLTPQDLPALPDEVTDDLDVHNVVTAAQRDGGTYTAEDDTGPLGSQDPPDGAGEYRQTVDVNADDPDNDLPQLANWWLRRGTVNLPRFPQLEVNLGALDADLIADVESVDVGSVIEVTGMREYTIRLHVLGYTETIRPADQGKVRRTITFTCAPDQQFQVGVLDTNRLQAAYTTLNAALTTTDTTVVLKSTNDLEQWRAGASTAHVMVAGEEIALGTIGARAGSGPWTFTVTGCTRSVNGIVKAQASGEPVKVVDAIRLAL